MKVVALVSGGKDSCFAMMKCLQYGHEIVALANLLPANDADDELDSYMYQTVGHQIVVCYAKCMGLPLFRRRISGTTRNHDLNYSTTPGDEVEDMFVLLSEVKRQIPSVGAVSSGAIASDYQRLRVESVCSRLGLVSFAYLWKQDQSLLLRAMIESGIVAVTVKVAALGLNPSKHLGKELSVLENDLHKLNELYGINVCGEGGEYETLTLYCPLFYNARIVLDDFQVVLHSSDSICPVGILHPLSFHIVKKNEDGSSDEETDLVWEVQGDSQQIRKVLNVSTDMASSSPDVNDAKLQCSKTRKNNLFTLSCWLQDSCKTSTDMQVDLELVLAKIEFQLAEYGYSWENVLYIHLYINDMDKFANANETYVKFITQEKCRFGVPSRSTIELPLVQVGLGMAYIEVLVADDVTKKVLHVQSISCWAPSCIGPYSQATMHKDVLYMAGQLGFDPPTMLLSSGGPTSQLEKAVENGEAISKSFNCSMFTSAILIVIYCSVSMDESDRIAIENKSNHLLKNRKLNNSGRSTHILDPILLYIFVPDLPKSAFVEVKPILYTGEMSKKPSNACVDDSSTDTPTPSYWGFKHEGWHGECIRHCVVPGKICTAVVSLKKCHAEKLWSSASLSSNGDEGSKHLSEEQIKTIGKFAVYHLDKILFVNHFSWDDVTSLRIHVAAASSTLSHQPLNTLSNIFTSVFDEFAQLNQNSKPVFNIVPVLGAGFSATSMDDDILTCELFSIKTS